MKVHDPVLKTGGAANTRLGIVTTRSPHREPRLYK
jgi:hypothetical protein